MEAPPYSDSPRPWTLISRKKYFIAYNGVSLALWATITLRAIAIMALLIPTTHLYVLHEALHPLLTVTQSLAILEIIHSLVGIVRASPLTTLLQIASRLFLVWGVVGLFPEVVANKRIFGDRVQHYPGAPGGSLAYAGILMAWGITECVRYSFFVWKECLGNDRVPSWLIWLRYNTFFVLYPMGMLSECWLIVCALEPAQQTMPWYNLFMKSALFTYIPGAYILYTHMISQRRRVIKGKARSY